MSERRRKAAAASDYTMARLGSSTPEQYPEALRLDWRAEGQCLRVMVHLQDKV